MLLVSASAFALTDDERKCDDAYNKAVRNVGNQEQKANRKCIKDNLSGDATSCVNAISAKAADKELKIEGLFPSGEKCDPVPAFGVDNGGAPAGDDAGKAAEEGTDDILRDLWGDPVDGIVTGDKCADAVAKRTGKIYDTILKAFRGCAKGLGAINTIGDLEGCVGTAIGDAKVTTFAGKLDNDVLNKCNAAPPIVDGTDDGTCGGEANQADFSDCATEVAKCNACLALNATTGGAADCTVLSGIPCGIPPATPHKCTFDGAVDNSQLQICFLGVCPAPIDISGAVDLTCNPALEDVNGKRPCQAALQTFDPFVLAGVGTICIDPGSSPCADGELDCDGGNALNQEVLADAQIGACTSNADCDGQCATYCASNSMAVYNGACENFCQGGTRADLACICDLFSGATCSGGVSGVNDCPGGSCEGKDNEADTDCHCTCIDPAVAPASAAGSMQYKLGIAIRVEADPICDNAQVLVRLPEQCAPFTTGASTVTQLQANETVSTQGPWTETGTAGNCVAFDSSTTTAFEFVSTLAFMDSTIGDLQSLLHVDCQ